MICESFWVRVFGFSGEAAATIFGFANVSALWRNNQPCLHFNKMQPTFRRKLSADYIVLPVRMSVSMYLCLYVLTNAAASLLEIIHMPDDFPLQILIFVFNFSARFFSLCVLSIIIVLIIILMFCTNI